MMTRPVNTCLLVLLALAGCAGQPPGQQAMVAHAPLPRMEAKPVDGRIFHDARQLSLFQDVRARQVGDVLTVVLTENTSGQKQADTNLDKSSDTSVGVPEFGGESWGKLGANLDSSNSFSGEGSSRQSNRLDGSITVMVTDTLPNGTLVVSGEKWISINQGDEYVRLSGIVRQEDIDTDNTVSSTRIADARISYGSQGAVHDVNRAGWLTRFFMHPIWPF